MSLQLTTLLHRPKAYHLNVSQRVSSTVKIHIMTTITASNRRITAKNRRITAAHNIANKITIPIIENLLLDSITMNAIMAITTEKAKMLVMRATKTQTKITEMIHTMMYLMISRSPGMKPGLSTHLCPTSRLTQTDKVQTIDKPYQPLHLITIKKSARTQEEVRIAEVDVVANTSNKNLDRRTTPKTLLINNKKIDALKTSPLIQIPWKLISMSRKVPSNLSCTRSILSPKSNNKRTLLKKIMLVIEIRETTNSSALIKGSKIDNSLGKIELREIAIKVVVP